MFFKTINVCCHFILPPIERGKMTAKLIKGGLANSKHSCFVTRHNVIWSYGVGCNNKVCLIFSAQLESMLVSNSDTLYNNYKILML